ncbi:carboxypeptidase-like regulatory domain-containing protein [Labilibaculum sp.]|uniref:carboxypeptidase-like regulatory domain-containing protein n=1 Tax=Labilibaculum sp. TaxID=2060723 RepID=UPI003567AD22
MKNRKADIQLMQRIISFALVQLLICLTPFSLFAQENLLQKKISINIHELTIADALDSIAAQNHCYFTYNSNLFADREKISLKEDNIQFEELLRNIIQDSSLAFQLLNKHIIIVPSDYKSNKVQNNSIIPHISYRTISGKITNQSAKTALPYASIGLRGKHIGTISNQDGEFSLSLSSANQKDTLVVSYVGFKNYEIPVSEIVKNQMEIKMKEDFISLQEVIIRNNNPKHILKAAINKIASNYPQKPAQLTSFYRESVLKNNKYMIYLESVLEIYKNPYSEHNVNDRVKIFKSRKIYDVSRLDTISFRLKGGIQGCLLLDIVQNQPEFLNPELMDLYHYQLTDISTYNNKAVYLIEFKAKSKQSRPLLEGRLIIETRSLAIIRAEFAYQPSRLREISNQFISKSNSKIKVRPTQIQYTVNYKKIGEKYYINHSLGKLKFKVKSKRDFFSQNFSTSFEMATTDVDTVNVKRFKHRETITPNTILSSEKLSYDDSFWGHQNFIKPEDNIKEAIRRINSSMQQIALDTNSNP